MGLIRWTDDYIDGIDVFLDFSFSNLEVTIILSIRVRNATKYYDNRG